MILVDANLPLYSVNPFTERHDAAKKWWDEQLSGSEAVGLSWQVIHAFIRIGSNQKLFKHALTLNQAIATVQSWLNQPCVKILQPTENHWAIFQQMLMAGRATGNFASDAHLAALAVEHNCVLCSTDTDFARFRGLKWKNPIA